MKVRLQVVHQRADGGDHVHPAYDLFHKHVWNSNDRTPSEKLAVWKELFQEWRMDTFRNAHEPMSLYLMFEDEAALTAFLLAWS